MISSTDREVFVLRKYPLLVIEGVDGSGKTTIAKRLSDVRGALYVKMPKACYGWISGAVERLGNRELEAATYIAITFLSSLHLRWLLRKGPVVCDKYIHTTLVAQECLGSWLIRLIKPLRYVLVPKPDATFCLTTRSTSELVRRCEIRGKYDDNDREMHSMHHRLEMHYASYPEITMVETDGVSVETVFSYILNQIE